MQPRPNALMLRLRPQGEHDVVLQAAGLAGKPVSTWGREILVAAARRVVGQHKARTLAHSADRLVRRALLREA